MEKTSLSILKQYWGFERFRPMQEEIVHEVLLGRDVLALLPTGGGKSICFQVPALQKDGICIVVSPLIALMKDQIGNLRKKGIEAVAVHAGMTYREIDILLDNCIFGNIKFLYLAPERLYSELVIERIKHMKVSLLAIDEAHCISEWGHEFRPAYRELATLRSLHPQIPFLALTATATPRVIEDIQQQLQFRQRQVLSATFRRDNLSYMALPETAKMKRLVRVLTKTGGSAIVYVRNRKETREVARFLLNHGISADFYHAGLDLPTRAAKQEAWRDNTIRVIVATNAFGMGIDKPDVRVVVHLDIPESLESYFQEAGRAGRDQKKAFAVLLFNQSDREHLWANLEKQFPDFKTIQQIYHHLCNYFQIAYGAGQGLSFDFELVDFCKTYELDSRVTVHAIHYLERERWLALSETVYVPPRFKFEVDFQQLYHFQIESANYDPLIKALLRSHGGIFDHFVSINEFQLGRKLGRPQQEIVNMLDYLQKQELATYLPQSNSPQLHFLQPRVDHRNLYVDTAFISSRKQVREQQIRSIDNYLDETDCRSVALQRYFGDETNHVLCGQCDLCLKRIHREKLYRRIAREIRNQMIDAPRYQAELLVDLTVGTMEERRETIVKLLDDGKLVLTDDMLSWADSV